MILIWLILIPLIGGLAGWLLSYWGPAWPRWVALLAMLLQLVIVVELWVLYGHTVIPTANGPWLARVSYPWIPSLGIRFQLSLDGLSLLLIVLTAFLGVVSVIVSWKSIQQRVGFFHLNLLFVLAGIVGVFLATDLFLFYFFWELMLVPMFFLIDIWGHENRHYAAIKFFLFTQLSGLLMLLSILGLVFAHGHATHVYTFDYFQLLGTPLPGAIAPWLMLGFFVAFAVKLPAVPLHTWLPDAHTEAPTAGSVILAGLLLKTGAYGLIRFVLPLFPHEAQAFAPVAMTLAVIGIIYGAVLAFAQTDVKRLVAYTSISHLGFVLLGIFAWNALALQGALMQMLAHGISTGALFALVGALQDRLHTRDLRRMGGLWSSIPILGGAILLFSLASLGLPGLGNFVGEFLILLGTWPVNNVFTIIAAIGMIFALVYSLWMVQQALLGQPREEWHIADLHARDITVMGVMIAVIVWLGLLPQPIFNTAEPALRRVSEYGSMGVGEYGSVRVWEYGLIRKDNLKSALTPILPYAHTPIPPHADKGDA